MEVMGEAELERYGWSRSAPCRECAPPRRGRAEVSGLWLSRGWELLAQPAQGTLSLPPRLVLTPVPLVFLDPRTPVLSTLKHNQSYLSQQLTVHSSLRCKQHPRSLGLRLLGTNLIRTFLKINDFKSERPQTPIMDFRLQARQRESYLGAQEDRRAPLKSHLLDSGGTYCEAKGSLQPSSRSRRPHRQPERRRPPPWPSFPLSSFLVSLSSFSALSLPKPLWFFTFYQA